MKKINRRSFLRTAGMVTAGTATSILLPLSLEAKETKVEMEPTHPNRLPPSNRIHVPTSVPYPTTTEEGQNIVWLQDHGGALINPYMGWTLHYYSNMIEYYGSELEPEDTVDDFPGIGAVYLRLPWAFLEPEEGVFTWETFDTPAQRWIDNGQQICLRVTAMESWMYHAAPKWIFEAGAKGYDVHEQIFEPEYEDPIFLEKVENFVAAMALRYDDNPNVAFVDVGHFGMWGEGHTVRTTPIHRQVWGMETQKKYIDIYCRHFKKTQLCISDDFAGPFAEGDRFPITDYAFSQGVTLRDDSILVGRPPTPWYHGGMAQLFWPSMPVILEHAQYGHAQDWGTWDNDLLVQSVEEYHASYMSIHWYPREELAGAREAIDRINRRLGYRLQAHRLSWPEQIEVGDEFTIESEWANGGVAPCYSGGFVCCTIKNERGGIVSVLVDESFNVRDLPVGAPDQADRHLLKSRFRVAPKFTDRITDSYRVFKPGTYDLYLSVGKADGTPVYQLPYEGEDGKRRYWVGKITFTGGYPPLPIRGFYPDKSAKRGGGSL